MKVAAIVLGVCLVLLQYRVWASPEGARAVWQLRSAVAQQERENEGLAQRNAQLKAEVKDLKEGLGALEERARHDLGMVGSRESFYQVVDSRLLPPAPQPLPTTQASLHP
jgi:cell division protein FtsB